MRVRVTSLQMQMQMQMQEGKLAEGLKILQATSFPHLRAQPGCHGVIVANDPATASGQVIVLWESQDALDALDERGFWESQVAQIIFLIAAVPERKGYDVNIFDFDADLHAS